jgi:coenzyme F420-reducing hydrogenase delta subunit/ferredoxin
MRSIHRYASDGFVIFLILHTLREYLNGRYRHYRWIAWISGIVLFIFTLIIGITGYWLVWDERGQLAALKTAELLNDIYLFVEPPSMSFLSNETLSGVLFFILHFFHLSMPLGMIILVGIHVMRCSRPVIFPPRFIAISILAILLVMSVIKPAVSVQPADLSRLPIDAPFDWFYFFIYPIKAALPKTIFWFIAISGSAMLFIMPWLKRHRASPAEVILANCTGCDQCNKDCPYGAIYMQPRTDNSTYKMEAVVRAERCASCGICFGSCDFNAVSMNDIDEMQFKEKIVRLVSEIPDSKSPKILGLICEKSINTGKTVDELRYMTNVKTISFPCIGMIHPSFVERGLDSGADGVFIWGCANGDCHYREGNTWLRSRLEGTRHPSLKKGVDVKRIREYWLSAIYAGKLREEINLFEKELIAYEDRNPPFHPLAKGGEGGFGVEKNIFKRGVVVSFVIIAAVFSILFFSEMPKYPFYNKNMSLIKFTFKYSGKHKIEQRELTESETKDILRHMRRTNSPFPQIRMVGKRERLPLYVELELDDRKILSKTYYPAGLRKDIPTFAYEEIEVSPGRHYIKIKMRDSKDTSQFNYFIEKEIDVMPERTFVLDASPVFSEVQKIE